MGSKDTVGGNMLAGDGGDDVGEGGWLVVCVIE